MIKCRFGEPHKVPKGCMSCIHYDKKMKACGKVTFWQTKRKTRSLDCNGPDKHSCVGCSHYQKGTCDEERGAGPAASITRAPEEYITNPS